MELSYYEKCLKRIQEDKSLNYRSGFVGSLYYSMMSDASYRVYFGDDKCEDSVVVPLTKMEAKLIVDAINTKINESKDRKEKDMLSRL